MTRPTRDRALPAYSTDSRDLPWNVMGGALSVEHTNVQTALIEQGLDYDTRTVEVQAVSTDADGFASVLPAPKHRAVVRPRPGGLGEMVVGVVGTRYTPIQNREAFAVADLLCAEWDSRIVGAADFRNGGSSLLVVDVHQPVRLTTPAGTEDVTDLYLLIRNAHDGSSALTFALTGMRVACTNALQAALGSASRTWKMSHTPNALQRVELAERSIVNSLAYHDAFEAQAQAMIDAQMTDREFEKIVAGLWPIEPEKIASGELSKSEERRLAVRAEVTNLYHTSPTIEQVRGTLWGGYNALVEFYDWLRPVRDGETSRAEGMLDGPYVRRKGAIWDLFSQAAPVA